MLLCCKKETSFSLILPAFVYIFALSPLWKALVRDETCRELNVGNISLGRSGDRIPVEARFSAPVQTGHGAHAAGYRVFPGGKAAGACR